MKFKLKLKKVFIAFLATIFLCEFLIYYLVLLKCNWPELKNDSKDRHFRPLKAMILADIHLLGPYKGHWFDKLRREWQMNRAFQTSMTLFFPEVVFILGDIFDEGHWVNNKEYIEYVDRFNKLFRIPAGTKLVSLVGNHDIGFHYKMIPSLVNRFQDQFHTTGIDLFTIRDINFITINSMAMEGDGCNFCRAARKQLENISNILNCAEDKLKCFYEEEPIISYSQPIMLQHFPTYRKSDEFCLEHDYPKLETFRENWEVLSKDATKILGQLLKPRLAFSGHSHNYCKTVNELKIEEYTVASFNWRNKNDPSFLLSLFTPDSYAISVCYMPEESVVLFIYIFGPLFYIIGDILYTICAIITPSKQTVAYYGQICYYGVNEIK